MVRQQISHYALIAIAALVTLAFAFPVYYMLVSAFEGDTEIISRGFSFLPRSFQGWGQFIKAFTVADLSTFLFNSVILAIFNVSFTVITSALAGYGFAKFNFPHKTLLFYFVISTMMIPAQILAVPLFIEVKFFGWLNTYPGLIVPGIMNAFGVFMMRQHIFGIPDDLIHAARADGAGELQIFVHVIVPMLKPALISLGIIIFIWTWGNFLWPLVAVTDSKLMVLATGITRYTQPYNSLPMWGAAMAAATIATLPMMVFLFFFQRYFVRGLTGAALKG